MALARRRPYSQAGGKPLPLPALSFEYRSSKNVVKAEWGAKRTCPKCATRFYDLGKDDPVTCVECGSQWQPDPVLKSKQPLPFDAPKPAVEKETEDTDLATELGVDEDEEPNADDDVDLGGDDDIGVATNDDDDEH
jgi:uncharacterized protein (TIGR02300 family)